MKSKCLKLTAIALVLACALAVVLLRGGDSLAAAGQESNSGLGNVDTLVARYQNWQADYVKHSGEGNIVLPLTPSRTLSTEFVNARGEAKINVINGTVDVEVQGLPRSEEWDVWVIDNI